MPSTPPISRIALVAPDAWPASSGRTAPITTLATEAKKDAVPMPASTNAGSSFAVGVVGLAMDAIHAKAIASRPSPKAMIGRPPIRSDSAPAAGAMNSGIAVQARVRMPASVGL